MITNLQKKIIKELQKDLPLVERPFEVIAQRLDMEEAELLQEISHLKEKGYIRRFGAALRHREVGLLANAMIVWRIPEDEIEEAGNVVAGFPEVTHCYHRQPLPHWRYNLFAMIHFSTKEECHEMAERIARAVGDYPYELLFSTTELKKTSMKYFAE
ncbi:MAG: Lrp/AsnC family transcriptional regulator [Bacillota bacterium]